MVGFGVMELLILAAVGFFILGIPIVLIVLLVLLLRNQNPSDGQAELSQLREENRRLRDELSRGSGKPS